MIKELQIRNFRNLATLNLKFNDMVSILTGQNGLGKSNTLNAASFGVTNTILTDKWGFGENDIDSIIPKGATRGINPEVTIINEVGTTFTKKFVSDWSSDGSKVKGHHTEWFVNGVKRNETEFKEDFYKAFNFTPKIKSKDVNELRLFTDPLYALQKLDAKQLRQLLVELGCSVTPEELYQQGFGDLRPYGDKYMNKWDVMRKDLKDKIKITTKEVESIQAKLETVATIEDYNPDTIKELNKEYEALISKKSAIQSGVQNPEIIELEKKIEAINAAIQTRIQEHQKNVAEQRSLLLQQKQFELDKAQSGINAELNPLKDELRQIDNEIERMNAAIQSYNLTAQNQSRMMQQYVTLANNLNEKKSNLSVKLDVVRNSKYENTITCPICGSEFPASEEDRANFEAHKQSEVQTLIKEIEKLEQDKASYKEEYSKAKGLRDEAVQTVDEARVNLEVARGKKLELEAKIKEVGSKGFDNSKVEEIEKKIFALDLPIDFSKEYQEIGNLKTKVETLKNADEFKIQDQVNEITTQINDLNLKISNEYVKQSKYKEKIEYEANLKASQANLNDLECLLARCNRLIQTMINLINEKATEKTGLTFVMLEENLTNDGIKEVCYATIIKYKIFNLIKLKDTCNKEKNIIPSIINTLLEYFLAIDTHGNVIIKDIILTNK